MGAVLNFRQGPSTELDIGLVHQRGRVEQRQAVAPSDARFGEPRRDDLEFVVLAKALPQPSPFQIHWDLRSLLSPAWLPSCV